MISIRTCRGPPSLNSNAALSPPTLVPQYDWFGHLQHARFLSARQHGRQRPEPQAELPSRHVHSHSSHHRQLLPARAARCRCPPACHTGLSSLERMAARLLLPRSTTGAQLRLSPRHHLPYTAATQQVAGSWLATWVSVSSVLASFCSVEANVAATAHSLHAMSELGFFPAFLSAVSEK